MCSNEGELVFKLSESVRRESPSSGLADVQEDICLGCAALALTIG